MERDYIIILKNHSDLDSFYDDMESLYGDNEIPNRIVDCINRRPSSRSTHYLLTDEEAARVAQDSRVESVTLSMKELGIHITPNTVQSSEYWDKSGTSGSNFLNWGILRGYERQTRSNWGSDGTTTVSGSVNLANIGNNVDVVIVDGHLVADHPEFAVNPDGTGGSRVQQFNWFQYNPEVRGTAAGTYVYDFLSSGDSNNNHGNNVGAIAAGNTCGWARGANIYNIYPYEGSTTANSYTNYVYDVLNYIKVWHQNKPINPKTGRKNPTVINMSYGFQVIPTMDSISRVRYRGQWYNQPSGGWTTNDRINFCWVASSTFWWWTYLYFPMRDASIDADVNDLYYEGIIMAGAAGNYYAYVAKPGDVDYSNYIQLNNGAYYNYMRGPSPGAAWGAITVSAADATVTERKADFSNAGTRTDVWAPGVNIQSAAYTDTITDPRNVSYFKTKMSGTSQATPQVTGLLACALEAYPNMTPAEALAYIQKYATASLDASVSFNPQYNLNYDYLNYNSLFGAPNLHATYHPERLATGSVFPKADFKSRPTSGRTYPRNKIRRYG